MDKEELRKLQIAQMEIMDEIHRICEKNNIQYYMIGGTALGAVRHNGFIPWDLDIDIAMRRNDYDRFKEVCKTDLDSRFKYCDYTNTHNIRGFHALVCINNTVLTLKNDKYNTRENKEIYLDILPLDNAPLNKNQQQKQAKKISNLKKLKQYKNGVNYSNNYIKKVAKKIISMAIFWTSVDKINKKADIVMRMYNKEESGYICSMASHYSYTKQCMQKEIYGIPQLVAFEDRQYYAPEKLDEYLKIIFNDYMKLPSKEEQEYSLSVFESVVFDK